MKEFHLQTFYCRAKEFIRVLRNFWSAIYDMFFMFDHYLKECRSFINIRYLYDSVPCSFHYYFDLGWSNGWSNQFWCLHEFLNHISAPFKYEELCCLEIFSSIFFFLCSLFLSSVYLRIPFYFYDFILVLLLSSWSRFHALTYLSC